MVAFGSPVVPEVNPSSATSSRPVAHRIELHRLVERDAVELGVVVGGAVETDHLLEEFAGLGAGDQLVGDAAVGQSASAISALSTILPSSPARSIGMVLTTTAPALVAASQARDQRRIVAGADQHAVARLDAVVLDQRMRQPVRPVGQFLVGAPAAIADQRDVVAEAALDHAVGQFDRGVEIARDTGIPAGRAGYRAIGRTAEDCRG